MGRGGNAGVRVAGGGSGGLRRCIRSTRGTSGAVFSRAAAALCL